MPVLAFGLKSAKSSAIPAKLGQKRKNLLDDGDSDDETDPASNSKQSVSKVGLDEEYPRPTKSPKLSHKNGPLAQKYTSLSAMHSAKKHDAEANKLDASVYSYDEVYDTFHAPKIEAASNDGKPSGPKYMTSLMQSAEVRKRDQLRAKEKQLKREREAEGDEFADKEKFVTSAYKAQQEEVRRLAEEEAKKDAEEEERRRKGGGMTGFHKDLLKRDEERSRQIAEAAKRASERPKSTDEPSVEETVEEKSEAREAAELIKRGAHIVVNDDGEVVDKRQLLSAGLNLTAKSQPAKKSADSSIYATRPAESDKAGRQTAGSRISQRERESRAMEAQIAAMVANLQQDDSDDD